MLITRPRRAFVQSAGRDTIWAKRAETGHAVAQTSPDGHRVMSRAGERTSGHIDGELVLGVAVGVAHRRHLGAHIVTPRRLFIQGGPAGVGRIPAHLKTFRF